MFHALGKLVNRYWFWILLGWIVVAIGLRIVAPSWDQVALDGDFEYLPDDSTSRRGAELLRKAFPDERAKSQIVLIFARKEGLTPEDHKFAFHVGHDRLATLKIGEEGKEHDLPWAHEVDPADPSSISDRVWTENTPVVGKMLRSRGERPTAVMVVGRLTTDLMATENVSILAGVKGLVAKAREDAPEGLEIGISGSAMIGGDMQSSVKESLRSTETTTVVLVLACLLIIYRSPLLVFIPMATIAVSLRVASDVIALMAQHLGPDDFEWSNFKIFTTTKIFVIVILFGAGTDFCLFLIARFKEELGNGISLDKASGTALEHVGEAISASAFTTILGLSTMFFATYGKFIYSGPVIAICLFIALCACLTFAPALLRALGKVVFWPFGVQTEKVSQRNLDFDQQTRNISPLWDSLSRFVMARPSFILWATVPFALFFINEGLHVKVTHDFMNELAADRVSKIGTNMVRQHYPPGEASPTTVIARLPGGRLGEKNNYDVAYLHNFLRSIEGVADVRSMYNPAGGNGGGRSFGDRVIKGSPLARNTFVSEAEGFAGEVTQLSVVLDEDPFSREARLILDRIEDKLRNVAAGEMIPETPPEDLDARQKSQWPAVREGLLAWKGADFDYIGTTSGIRDLERTTEADRKTIQILVVAAVFTVILVILRRLVVCLFLILTVVLSYWVTIGVTEMVFKWYYGATFDGLDWKVPIFLFVILIAVGQDYNIYLVTRVFEEQEKFGLRRGLRRAMVQTGGIITSCGVIMAGTFIAMATGTLRGMIELGFSLSFGILLDTFFVRTIVVPSFLAILARREPIGEPPVLQGEQEPPNSESSASPGNLHRHTNGARHLGDPSSSRSNTGR